MKRIDLTFRIIKVGGKAVSVAICAMTGMMFMGGAMADVVIPTGTSTPAVQDIGGNPAFNIQSASIDALGVTTYINPYSGSGISTTTSSQTVLNNTITLQSGNKITGRTLQDGSTYAAVYSQNTVLSNGWNTHYNYTSLAGATFDVQGNNIVNGAVGLNFTNWGGYATYVDPLAVVNLNGYNVTFGNAVYAANTYIKAGTNNTVNNDFSFYGTLNSDLTFNQAASVLLNGGLSGFTAQSIPGSTNPNTANGNLNFNGFNSYVTLGANQGITGNVTTSGVNGVLIFQGAGNVEGTVGSGTSTLKEVRTNGTGNVLFNNASQQAYVDYVNYQAATLVGFNGGLNLTVDQSVQAKNQVAFNNNDGVLQINNGNLTGKAGTVVVSTTGNNLGTVTMVSGTQAITGGIGASGHAIKTLNIGGEITGGLDSSNVNYSTTTTNGDIYAQNINLNNGIGSSAMSSLIMASGYNLTGTVNTDTNHSGILTLAGGTQTVTGTVGATGARLSQVNSGATGASSTFTGNVFTDSVNNSGTGSSTFNANVTATTSINVTAGTTLVSGTATVDGPSGSINVTSGNLTVTGATSLTGSAASINVGSGAATFNGTTSITTGDVNFTGNGTIGFNQNVSFTNLNYAGKAGIVNVASGKNITATAITTTTNDTGTLNMLGGTQTVNATVGANTLGLNLVTAGADSATTNFTNTAAVYANTLQVTGNGAVNLSGGLVGNLSYTNNVAGENGTVTVAAGKNVIGTITTGSNGVNNAGSQGILTMAGGGTQQVSGAIGSSTAALKTINAGATGSTASLNGMVFADTVLFSGDGAVALNGTNGGSATGGLVGTANLAHGYGTLQIGTGVNLTTGTSGIQFANANNATLRFVGTSDVYNNVGSGTLAAPGTDVFSSIQAGYNGQTVTFHNDVHVSDLSQNLALDVMGTGTVNLMGDLYGPLLYQGDGIVNVSNSKSIFTAQTQAATTTTNGNGTLNFLGSTTLNADIGTSSLMLKAVNFNTATNNVTQAINHNVYATDVTIGGTAGTTAISKLDVTGVYDYAGATSMFTFAGGTTANLSNVGTTGAIALGGNLVIANATTAVNVGVAHVATGNVTTNGGAMSFTVNSTDITTGGSVSASAGSGQVTATGALTMTGTEKVHVNYVGSLANAGTYALVKTGVATGTARDLGTEAGGKVSDNSFSIDTSVHQATATTGSGATLITKGDLILVADRTAGATYAANQNYIQKAGTVGDYSNNAGIVLGGIAAAGTQTGDMVKVIQMLEIDSFGYGNSAANLATQVKRLAPVANASLTQASFAATNLTTNTIDGRMSSLRGDNLASIDGSGISAGDAVKSNAFWLKGYGTKANQSAIGQYDGYKFNTGGLAMGADTRLDTDLLIGLAISNARTEVDQQGFRQGDSTTIKSLQLTGYGSYDLSKELYIDGDISYTNNKYSGNRTAAVGRTAQASYSGNQLMARVGAGYRIALQGKAVFTPLASLEFSNLATNAYTETGAGAINLAVGSQSLNRTRLGLGARLNTELESNGTIYRPELSAMWLNDSGALTRDTTATFTGGGTSFTTPGADVVRNTFNIGAGVAVTMGKNSSVLVRYDYTTHSGYNAQTVQATGRWAF